MTDLKITNGHVVEFNYTLKDSEGVEIDSSEGHGPMPYIHGKQNIVPGLEREMTGKKVGDKLKVSVEPSQGYGERFDDLVQKVPRDQFEKPETIKVGEQFQVQNQHGELLVVQVVAIEGQNIVLDGNHPLAGVTLHFDVEVMSIREATKEELAHGHLHSHGSSCSG